jgi:uncharacterized protein YvpB
MKTKMKTKSNNAGFMAFLNGAAKVGMLITLSAALIFNFYFTDRAAASITDLQKAIGADEINTAQPAAEAENRAVSDADVKKAQDAINNDNTSSPAPPAAENSPANPPAAPAEDSSEALRGVISPDLDNVNIRSGPWGDVIGKLYGGKFVHITGEEGDWYIIDYNGQKGYILKSALNTNKGVKSNYKQLSALNAKVTNCSTLGLNVRGGAWGEKIGWLANDSAVTIIGEDGDWYKIEFEGRVGYVYKSYIEAGSKKESAAAAEKPAARDEADKPSASQPLPQPSAAAAKEEPKVSSNAKFDKDGHLNVPERSQRAPENGAPGNYYCGPTSLGMALDYYGVNRTTKELAKSCSTTPDGTSAGNLLAAAKRAGMNGSYMKEGMSIDSLKEILQSGKPVVVNVNTQGYWGGGHYMTAVGVSDGKVYLNDPWAGTTRSYTFAQFSAQWSTRWNRGIVIQP